MAEQYYCYRYIDAGGEVAYIGRTKNLLQRIKQHRKDLLFIEEPTIQYTLCSSYRDSVDKELFLIQKYRPYLNGKVLPNKRIYAGLAWHDIRKGKTVPLELQ